MSDPVPCPVCVAACKHGEFGACGQCFTDILDENEQLKLSNSRLGAIAFNSADLMIAKAENQQLRAIFPKILEALESGGCSPDCSVEFLQKIPEEVRLVVAKLKNTKP